jgi:hypothetical protein
MADKDQLMNGASSAAIAAGEGAQSKPAWRPDPSLVALAERLVVDVKSGAVTSLAALLVNATGNVQWPAHGTQALELYFGAAAFQRQIEQLLTGRNNSRILRPGG